MDSLTYIAMLQAELSAFDGFLRWLSLHTYCRHYLLITALIFWFGYRQLSTRLMIGTFVSAFTFMIIKPFFQSPRPFWLDDNVYRGINEVGYGMPSGHAQCAVVFFGLLACSLKNKAVTLFCITMAILVGVSRIYLGVHFPSQVIAGGCIGLLIVGLYLFLESTAKQKQWSLLSTRTQVILLTFTPLTLAILAPLLYGSTPILPSTLLFLFSGIAMVFLIHLQTAHNYFSVPSSSYVFYYSTIALSGTALTIALWSITATPQALENLHSPLSTAVYYFFRGCLLSWWVLYAYPFLFQLLHKQLLKRTVQP